MNESLEGGVKVIGLPAVNLKILVPAVASGAIIGKGGETIADIQKQTGTRIKMSKSNDFYPGTTERVGLIQGPPEAVLSVVDFITEKVVEKPDPTAKPAIDFDNKICAEREKQIKIIVPNSTAGMIIGKGGSFIKQLKDESGAFIQISQKSKETTLPERVVTIIGDPTTNRKALEMIICKILEDPHSSSCLNISYGEVQGLVANPHPTGSPYAPVIPNGNPEPAVVQPSSSISTSNKSSAKSISPFVVSLGNGKSLDLSINTVPGWPAVDQTLMTQYLKQISVPLRSHGFTENTVDEIVRSLGCLATHGILTLEQLNSDPKAGTTSQAWSSSSENSSPLADLEANKINVNSYGLVTPTVLPVSPAASASNSTTISNQNEDVVDMDVQEHVVGAILGPGGRSIVELQQFSGARIQISKKGAFSPGTRNRVVTISGSHQAVATAKYLIEKRIQEEQDENRLSCY